VIYDKLFQKANKAKDKLKWQEGYGNEVLPIKCRKYISDITLNLEVLTASATSRGVELAMFLE